MLNTTKYLIATLLFTLVAPAAALASPIIDPQVVDSTPAEHGASLVLPLVGVALLVVLLCVAVIRTLPRHASGPRQMLASNTNETVVRLGSKPR